MRAFLQEPVHIVLKEAAQAASLLLQRVWRSAVVFPMQAVDRARPVRCEPGALAGAQADAKTDAQAGANPRRPVR